MDEFTNEERKKLEPFISNLDSPVFALTNLPEVVKGALFSRYSRSQNSLKRVLLKEFMGDENLLFSPSTGNFTTKKAEEFYDRVLVGYGDDSVAELAGAHIALEKISIIATKVVEDARIGLSPLEKSTRYVYFDKLEDDKWQYLREKTIMDSEFQKQYIESCDLSFSTYANLIPKISKFIEEREKKDVDTSERAYQSSIRAKTCDILRGLLPASTLTNMGFFGDGRAYEFLLTKMYSDDLIEIKDIALLMQQELAKVIPSFVKRADNKYGKSMQEYYKKTKIEMDNISKQYSKSPEEKKEDVKLVDYDEDGENKVIAAALYPHLELSFQEINDIVEKMSDKEKQFVIDKYIGERENRRQKPGRGFEHSNYTFDIIANYGCYRDMHRHRILTQQRQLLSTSLGYIIPKEIEEAGFINEYKNAMETASNAFEEIAKKYPKQAQYVVPLAYNIRWYMSLNAREAYHMLELRSSRQGHMDYRVIAQKMFREIEKVHPNIGKGMKYMDMGEYDLERLESEKKIDEKLEKLKEKYGR